MKTVKGNLLDLANEGHFDVIIHGANCFCTMNSGIAKQIRVFYPEAYKTDCATLTGDISKLGSLSIAEAVTGTEQLYIVNAYTQYKYGTDRAHVNYSAVRKAMSRIKVLFHDKRIGYPKIGAGLAGGDWEVISQIIDEELEGEDHTLVELST